MESWRSVWRRGIAPQVTAKHLEPLFEALRDDDLRLLQGATTSPPVMQWVQNWPVAAADAIGFMGWKGWELETVGEVEEFFDRMCFEIDQLIGEPAACRWFLNWFDDTPREEMRHELLAEVWRSLALAYCVE